MTECLSYEAKSGCSPNFKWRCMSLRFDGPRFGVLFPDKKYGTNIHVSVATGAYRVSGSDYRQYEECGGVRNTLDGPLVPG